MKRFLVWSCAGTCFLVAMNALSRSSPRFSAEMTRWLSQYAPTSSLVAAFLKPGLYALWYLGFTPDSAEELAAMTLISFWVWSVAARTFYAVVGRWFGFYNPDHFRYFLWVPWRTLWTLIRLPLRWREEIFKFSSEASGGWASLPDRFMLVFRAGDIFLGRVRAFGLALQQPVGVRGERHVTMIAGAGSGKTSHAIAWLTMHLGTAFIIDPKGLIARVTAARMGQGGPGVFGKGMKVRILDPLRMVDGKPKATFCCFAQMERYVARNGPSSAVRYAVKIADGLIVQYGRENPFWPGSAKEFLTGLILYVFDTEPPERRSLIRLHELLCNGLPEKTAEGKNPFGALLRDMSRNPAYGGIIAGSANALADAGETTYGNVLITMREQLKWLKLPETREVCRTVEDADETVNLEELVIGKLVLYLCAPVTDIRGPMAGWFRLLSVLALHAFEDFQRRLAHPCLFLLDEFPSLGKIESIEIAAPVMRSMGVRLCVIAQDLAQLRDVYPNTWEGFIGNAEACMWMGSNHQETLLYLEKALGTKMVRRKVDGGGWFSKTPVRHEHRNEPVMYAEQLKRLMGLGNIVVTRPDFRPFTTKRTPYFNYSPAYFFDADRDHREARLRRLTRAVFAAAGLDKKSSPPLAPPPTGQQKLVTAGD